MRTCEPFIYIVDGKSLNFPIVKSERINTHHWLPVSFKSKGV